MIILMAGLPASGKTTLARELAARTGGLLLNKDEIRAALFPAAEIEYSSQQDDFCIHVMLEVAGYMLGKNPSRMVFLDGRPFSRRQQIDDVIAKAEALHQPWRILHCFCSESSAKERLQRDEHIAGNRNLDLYLRVKASFEKILRPQTLIDTDRGLAECVEQALPAITP